MRKKNNSSFNGNIVCHRVKKYFSLTNFIYKLITIYFDHPGYQQFDKMVFCTFYVG